MFIITAVTCYDKNIICIAHKNTSLLQRKRKKSNVK
jgi:hypothetical protein